MYQSEASWTYKLIAKKADKLIRKPTKVIIPVRKIIRDVETEFL